MLDHKLVNKGTVETITVDVYDIPDALAGKNGQDLSTNNKRTKFRVEGRSGHYEVVQNFNQQGLSDPGYWFDTQTNTDRSVKDWDLLPNVTNIISIRDIQDFSKPIVLELQTGPVGGMGYFNTSSAIGLSILDDGVLIPYYTGLTQLFKYNLNTGIIDPSTPDRFTYNLLCG